MYDKCVAPIMDYGAEVWGLRRANKCDQVQNRAIRYYIGVHRFAPILAIQGDMGWVTPINRRAICMLRFWNRLINMDDDRIPKILFKSEYGKENDGWCNDVESIFDQIGLKHIYDDCVTCDIHECKRRLMELLQREFLEDIKNKPKLRSYVKFKSEYATASYLCMGMSREKRSLLGQLRCGILPLEIERGRFKTHRDNESGQVRRLTLEERVCKMCTLGELEDEMHFVCICNKYKVCRNVLYNLIQLKDQTFNNEKFVYLLKHCDKELSNYVRDAWYIRKRAMYNVV